MGDSKLAKTLKDLNVKLQSSSLTERRLLFQDLQDVFTSQEIDEGKAEAIVRGVSKLLLLTLARYHNQSSRNLVNSLLLTLLEKQGEYTLKHLPAILSEYAKSVKDLAASENVGREMLSTLQWTCLILLRGFKDAANCGGENFKQLVEAQSIFLSLILAVGNEKYHKKADRLLAKTWKAIPGVQAKYAEVIPSLEPSYFVVVLGSSLLTEADASLADKLVPVLLDLIIKTSVTTKTKPPTFVLEHSKPLLKRLTHDQFKSQLLPALLKAMLRSPEIILDCVGRVLQGLSLDLSRYAGDFGKPLAANLHSKEDLSREEAIRAVEALARQCSEPAAVRGLFDLFFAVLQGSEGKLTVTDHKISVLEGIGKVSQHCVTGNAVQQLSSAAAEHFVKVLETEAHEGTLVHALQMLSLWTSRLSTEIPKSLMQVFKNGLTLKSATAPVRTAYINCMSATLHGDLISKGLELVPTLLKSLERAAAQPTQAAVVTEGLGAVNLMIRLASSDTQFETACNGLVPVALDMDKQLFLNDKFLASCGDDGLYQVAVFCEQLLTVSPYKPTKTAAVYRGLIISLLRPGYPTRNRVSACVKRVLSSENRKDHAVSLCRELTAFLQSAKVTQKEDASETGSTPAPINEVTVHALSACVEKITNVEVSDEVAVACFMAAHHPGLVSRKLHLWKRVVLRWGEDLETVAERCYEELKKIVVDEYETTAWNEAAAEGLVRLAPEKAIPDVLKYAGSKMQDTDLLKVSRDDYFVHLVPEGTLYDRSVVENVKDDPGKNLKRESRVYSYKEQMEEMQLKRELEEKKKREGKWKEPEYTPKQKEAIKQQLEKESTIRARVTALVKKVNSAVSLLSAAVKGNPSALAFHMKEIVQEILRVFSSPAAAPAATKLWLELRKNTFYPEDEILAQSVAHVTLRLLKPQCDLDSSWETENLDAATQRVVGLLLEEAPLSSATFNYSFPLIRAAVQAAGTQNENLASNCVQLLQLQAQTRELDDKIDNPRLLPLREMMEILIKVISQWGGRVQQQACAALGDVAKAISGIPGCAVANEEEITCLLDGLENVVDSVRDTCLISLRTVVPVLPTRGDSPLSRRLIRRLWVAKYDVVPETREIGAETWNATGVSLEPSICTFLLEDVAHMQEPIRNAAAEALAAALQLFSSELSDVLQDLLELYEEKLVMAPPVMDNFGRVLEPALDIWQPRAGIGFAFAKIAPLLQLKSVSKLAQFFVQKGLGDRNEAVRKNMLEAAVAVVDLHGKEAISDLLPVFENFMDVAPKSGSFDSVRQSVIVLMGSLARHLDKEDPRVKPIFIKLVDALSTPSQQVQEAVANCLPPLAPAMKDEAGPLVQKLLQKLLESDNYGERKGAAYGIAGIVKGLGILTLKQLDIMSGLTDAIQDKKNFRHREGALFAFEQLCNMLGRLFEPYIVHVLPHLLLCFGDSNQYVREAADDTAKAVMSKLSAHGVKLVLPSLLNALEQDSWRTKTGSVELLGAMAYCAPRQLSSCLPSIVPKLIEVLGDSHVKVQAAGAQALQMIGSVIRNPEIQAIVPVLLGALQDPAKKTSPCLATLLETKFVHFIDAPSLALIMPVVQRAFQDRSTETRKMAAQIIGNMYSLTDQKDLSPYLPTIIPGLKASLLDPVPEVRGVSSRALGAMVRGMGEASFDDLLPWLMQTLTSETSSVDRSGAAQGLSEVVGGLGVDKLHKLMPEIIATAERADIAPHVKDGYIMMFIYMPVVFQSEFTQYISQIIPPILKALADENEFVRDTALRAGQRIVNMYADTAITLLLPELEEGLLDDNWRIRFSSVQLLGDLLYKISGVSGKMTTETASEDDNFGTEQSHKAILETLGAERRNRVLSGLYMGRSDVALLVRQAALHVWKVVVTNTPRTLREILPTLFGLLLGCLASTSFDKRQVAARTLGDLVRKLGERVLPEIIPILERGLESEEADQRQGVCIGLSEIMASTSREMILTFVDSLVPTIRKALCDPLEEVRQAAARTFDSLHSTVGSRALDDILPFMLDQLNDDSVHEHALDGLRQVMAIKSRVVLPYLIPQLTAPPINTKALSVLASVAGEALARHFSRLLPALLSAVTAAAGTPTEAQELEYCRIVLLSVQDDQGVRVIMDELIASSKSDKVAVRRAAVALLAGFCADTKIDYIQYVPQLLRGLIHLLVDTDTLVLTRTWEALNAVIQTLDATEQLAHVGELKQAVRFAASDLKGQELLPGFCLPKGIVPLLPIYREAILNGAPDLKEQAAQGLGELIKLTSAEALKPSVVNITGPLIRILGDRFSAGVKIAVLETLALLLAKVGALLKPFLPQLQTTFVKSLTDPNRQVRLKAAAALGHLIVIHTRADPLFTELHTTIKNAEDSSIRETTLQAMRGVISPAGDKMTEAIRKTVVSTLQSLITHPEDNTRAVAAGCLGAIARWLPAAELEAVVNESLLNDDPTLDWTVRHGRSAALSVALKEAPSSIYTPESREKIHKTLLSYLAADRVPLVMNSIRAIGYLFRHLIGSLTPLPASLIQPFAKILNHNSNEVKQLVAQVSQYLARRSEKMLPADLLRSLLPQLVNGTKEKNTAVRAACESALVSVLRLRHNDDTQQQCVNLLDLGARESLTEVINKVLKKMVQQPESREEELDVTIVT